MEIFQTTAMALNLNKEVERVSLLPGTRPYFERRRKGDNLRKKTYTIQQNWYPLGLRHSDANCGQREQWILAPTISEEREGKRTKYGSDKIE